MTPRIGLYVAVVGLAMAGLATVSIFMGWNPYPPHSGDTPGPGLGFFLFLCFGALFGVVIMVVGLALFGVLALIRQRNKPSLIGLVFQVAGVMLLVCCYNASQAVGDAKVGETMAYLIGGSAALWTGAALALWGSRRDTA